MLPNSTEHLEPQGGDVARLLRGQAPLRQRKSSGRQWCGHRIQGGDLEACECQWSHAEVSTPTRLLHLFRTGTVGPPCPPRAQEVGTQASKVILSYPVRWRLACAT